MTLLLYYFCETGMLNVKRCHHLIPCRWAMRQWVKLWCWKTLLDPCQFLFLMLVIYNNPGSRWWDGDPVTPTVVFNGNSWEQEQTKISGTAVTTYSRVWQNVCWWKWWEITIRNILLLWHRFRWLSFFGWEDLNRETRGQTFNQLHITSNSMDQVFNDCIY